MSIFKTALAPLAGFSDGSFRRVCKRFGADIVTTEMVSAKGLFYSDKKTATLLAFEPFEQPVLVQIFGSEPEIMAFAAKEVSKLSPAGIDINMGCPMPKIVNNGDGCALMKDLKKAESVIRAVVSATELPVSVKFRSGYDEKHINAVEFGVMCEEAGAKSITGVDGIAVGRGALGNPFIFAQIKSYIQSGSYSEFDEKTRLTVALDQVRDMCLIKGEKVAIPEARKHLAYYLKGMHGAA